MTRADGVLDVVAAALILAGCGFAFFAGLGLVRFPDVLSRLQAAANRVTPGSPEEFPAYLTAESGKWGEVIRTRGTTGE